MDIPQEEKVCHHQITLEKSLSPLWKISYYGGFLVQWLRPVGPGQSTRWIMIARSCWVFFTLLITLFMGTLLSVQLAVDIEHPLQIGGCILVGLLKFSIFPVAVATQIDYLANRKKYRAFFESWNRFEQPVQVDKQFGNIKKSCINVYIIYLAFMSFYLVFTLLVTDCHAYFQLFFEYFSFSCINRENYFFIISLFRLGEVLSAGFGMFFVSMADIVPSFVYLHLALGLHDLQTEMEAISARKITTIKTVMGTNSTEGEIQRIWWRYETIRRMIQQTDKLFGPLISLNQGSICFALCSIFFVQFFVYDHSSYNSILTFTVLLFIFAFRLLFSLSMMSRVNQSAEQLQSAVSDTLAGQWQSLDESERRILLSFLSRMQSLRLAANPNGFYKS